ncbi:L-amino acid N-acyltransferase YncA [Georgenia satyanarayanai]|uniref:L-amino acid N-acyltransferase YncA n=1 Tax=Georgenia satyanarayanai TaxID=860221 RepID=A0A2Y9AQJ5_9MICO|nr:GNAT family N-acetyltransferase [Georgenia satyanarayanai]PYF97269.1 L-amino acid N-acyltransferase YncA [Georgenia satyanarayanai]SSA46355.1 L-amino acid N-acyltransferase YncA [Georgenia satyanarayanai]
MDVRWAHVCDAPVVAQLLHDFNVEFDSHSPGVAVLTARLEELLPAGRTSALVAGDPAVGVALLTSRPNIWYDGPVLLLDELYVVPELRDRGIGTAIIERLVADATAEGVSLIEINVDEEDVDTRRFYERHGFATGTGPWERAFYYERELHPQIGA